MSLGHRILVPLDGSSLAARTLPLATSMARQADGSLLLLGVYIPWVGPDLPPPPTVMSDFYQASRDQLAAYLDETAAGLRESGVNVETELRGGRAHTEILRACRESGCDVIAMATHGRTGFDRLSLGSVADRVIRRAAVPVLLVSAAGSTHADGAATEMGDATPRHVRSIVIPLDGSPLAEEALVPATALGEVFGAEYILIRVVSPLDVLSSIRFKSVPWDLAVERERAAARRQLEEVAGRMREVGYRVTVVVSEENEPVRAILRLVAGTPDSLLAMATHGRGGLRRAFIGSIADRLVRANTRPMLLVRQPRRRARLDERWLDRGRGRPGDRKAWASTIRNRSTE